MNLFPIFVELRNKTNNGFLKMQNLGQSMTLGIYIIVSVICIFMFGAELTTESSVLKNIGNVRTPSGGIFWEASIVQISFMLVLTCHIPFVFFSGKEAACIIVDEIDRKSISTALWHKL